MVFLTRALCKRNPNTTTFYKYQQILRATGHVIGRAGNERKIARYKVDLDLAKQTRAIRAGIVENENNKFVECRLKAACDEHRITLATFLDSLARMSIQLDKVSYIVFTHIHIRTLARYPQKYNTHSCRYLPRALAYIHTPLHLFVKS